MVIDTNILIAYLNGEPISVEALSRWKQEGRALFVSSISVAEILSLPKLSNLEIQTTHNFLKEFISVPFDDFAAEQAAQLRRFYKISLPDAAIAAAAFMRKTPLITRDRQFKKVKEIIVIEI